MHPNLNLVCLGVTLGMLVLSATATQCNSTNLCPSSAPCCSEFGFCGKGHFCLGGCNPLASNSLTSCKPAPVCKDLNYSFADNSRILSNSSFFDGNASEYDWVVEKGNIMNTNTSGGELALLLTETNGGTRISSTRYVHYGTITARLKASKWAGVVTAFITMSNIKDEIDWEFPGGNSSEAQSNYFWQGVIPTGKNDGETHKGLSDVFSNYHDYTIDWQPDALTFKIDGQTVRTVKKSDKVDGGIAKYPSTPSRIQFSIWPAGISSSGQGTIDWAGGMIDWNNADYKAAGHYYMLLQSVTVKCSDPTKPSPDITSYVYGSNETTDTPSVAFSNQSTSSGALGITAAVSDVHLAPVLALVIGLLGLVQFF